MLKKISNLLNKQDKIFLLMLVFFSIFISLIETLAVSIVMPFVAIANDFNIIQTNKYTSKVFNLLSIDSNVQFVALLGILVFLFYIFRGAINMFYYYMLAKFSEGLYFKISKRLFENYLHLGNEKFNSLNTAHLTKMIINEASYMTQVISSLLHMISEFFVIIFIYALLFYVDWQSTLVLSFVLLVVMGLILRKITHLVKTKGKERELHQRSIYDILAASFGNFKVIKLFSNEKEVVEKFTEESLKLVQSNIVFETSSHVPRLLLDTLGFASLGLVVTFLVWRYNADISEFMPILSLYVLALYRLLPSIHRLIVRYNKIMFYSKAVDLIYDEMGQEQEVLGNKKIIFQNKIVFDDVSFSYKNGDHILSGVNLSIDRGHSIGIVGESGSGKSTLVDMLIGLNLPTSGDIVIDDQKLSIDNMVSWRKQIGYIPQSIYLFDGTVGENIAFGREYNKALLIEILKKVKLWDMFNGEDGLDKNVGEAGKLLSGGQRQRIAIARALYSSPEILVLDEATSSLDSKTEREIMQEIYRICVDKTLIIISHNKSILGGCDEVFTVENKRVSL
ncbi:MAG TPA: ABC transporter ATP-binding protein [Sulfurimonas autotrophica]|nr:ABC transporter ATP-binding protein [Sulfurimonas autotrophica]